MSILEDTSEVNFIGLNKKENSWKPLSIKKLINPSSTSDLGIITLIITTKKISETTTSDTD